MRGYVVGERKAFMTLRIKGRGGAEISVDAMIDTGFDDYLALPDAVVEELDLPAGDKIRVTLADGTRRLATEYSGHVLWDEQWRPVPIQGGGNDALCLVGMGLLFGHYISMELEDGGAVTTEPIS